MNCSDANALLDLFHDDELEPRDAALVLEHLDGCTPCTAELDSLQELRSTFVAVREATPAAPSGLLTRVSARLDAEGEVTARRKKRWAPYTVAFSSAIAAVTLVLSLSVSVPNPALVPAAQLIDSTILSLPVDANHATLSQQLGFDMHFVTIPGWHPSHISVLPAAGSSSHRIARVDFARTADDTMPEASLTCYQSLAGSIKLPDGAETVALGARRVALGRRGNLSFALWTENQRDYLFVSTMPRGELEELVRG